MAARRTVKSPLDASSTVVEATEAAIKAAVAAKTITEADAGAVAALRSLARTIDALGAAERDVIEEKKRPQLDNVTIPTFLKYLDALGLTPAGRKALVAAQSAPAPAGSGQKSRFQQLREEQRAREAT